MMKGPPYQKARENAEEGFTRPPSILCNAISHHVAPLDAPSAGGGECKCETEEETSKG